VKIFFRGGTALDLARPRVLGVLNVTPDSFSDGGRFATLDGQIARAFEIAAEGAAVLDVGGESTRPRGPYGPGAAAVDADEERRRVLPLLEALEKRAFPIPISVDTRKAAVAKDALERGAAIINDVSALSDPDMLPAIEHSRAAVILMHMKGTPEDMQLAPSYDDVVAEVEAFLRERLARAQNIPALVDPGIGFGKTAEHNWQLLRATARFAALAPVVVGVSRKGFLGALVGQGRPVEERLAAGIGAGLAAAWHGARLLRTHDVRPTVDALRAFEAAS
jgi:dihydropteroate synthase